MAGRPLAPVAGRPNRYEAVPGYTLLSIFRSAPGLPQGFKHLSVEQLIPELSVKTLHVAILPRTARLDVELPDSYGLEPVPNRLVPVRIRPGMACQGSFLPQPVALPKRLRIE